MCNHTNREAAMTVLDPKTWCDPCLAPLRAILAAHPAPPNEPRCDSCGDTGRVQWMSESDPHLYNPPDDGTVPCLDCVPPSETDRSE